MLRALAPVMGEIGFRAEESEFVSGKTGFRARYGARVERAWGMLVRREGGAAEQEGEGEGGVIGEAWQGLYEVFREVRREVRGEGRG